MVQVQEYFHSGLQTTILVRMADKPQNTSGPFPAFVAPQVSFVKT